MTIETDLDYVDAWMRDLGPGDCVRVVCSSPGAPDADGNVHIQCYGEPLSSVRAKLPR